MGFGRIVVCLALALSFSCASAQDTIKVGVLHSLSGTMAISETVLKDTVLMAIEEINARGGVLGKKLEPVVVDPASNWPLYAAKAKQLITEDKVVVTFGGWTSVSRKSVLPVFEEYNSLLFYPGQYEGEELSKNVFYTGAVPNQQAIPAVEYLMSKDGGGAKRFVLLGTDYVYPQTTNKILRAFLKSKGIPDADIMESYTPFGHSDYQTIVARIKKFASESKKVAVLSTIAGNSNEPFYKELGNQGLKATDVSVMSLSVGEGELRGIDTKPLVGHLAAWNYFMSLKSPENAAFTKKWADYAKAKKLLNADEPLTNDSMEATFIGVHMWKQAVEKAKSTDTDKVIAAMAGQTFKAPSGFVAKMDEKNHHLQKPVFIGEVRADGQFNVVWKTAGLVRANPWSPYIPENKGKSETPKGGGGGGGSGSSEEVKVVRTYFGTSREKKVVGGQVSFGAGRANASGGFSLGFADVSVPSNKSLGALPKPSWIRLVFLGPDASEHMLLKEVKEMNAKSFATSLTSARRAFIFVHGYNVSFEDAALRTAQLAVDLDIRCAPMFFSWPSKGGLLKYTHDWTENEWTKPHLKAFFEFVAGQTSIEEIYVIAHSMGGNATVPALAELLSQRADLRGRFRELILAAPDIDADVFKDQLLPQFRQLTTGITLYASENDKALRASDTVHGEKRAGRAGTRLLVASGVETIDATFIDTNWLGHSTAFEERALLTDMSLLISNGMRASARPSLETLGAVQKHWRFRK